MVTDHSSVNFREALTSEITDEFTLLLIPPYWDRLLTEEESVLYLENRALLSMGSAVGDYSCMFLRLLGTIDAERAMIRIADKYLENNSPKELIVIWEQMGQSGALCSAYLADVRLDEINSANSNLLEILSWAQRESKKNAEEHAQVLCALYNAFLQEQDSSRRTRLWTVASLLATKAPAKCTAGEAYHQITGDKIGDALDLDNMTIDVYMEKVYMGIESKSGTLLLRKKKQEVSLVFQLSPLEMEIWREVNISANINTQAVLRAAMAPVKDRSGIESFYGKKCYREIKGVFVAGFMDKEKGFIPDHPPQIRSFGQGITWSRPVLFERTSGFQMIDCSRTNENGTVITGDSNLIETIKRQNQ